MAETDFGHDAAEFETRIAALEKSIAELRRTMMSRTAKLVDIHAEATTSRENSARVVAMLEEVLPLIRRAAPLLDSPMAKLAQSPAGGVLSMFTGGRRG